MSKNIKYSLGFRKTALCLLLLAGSLLFPNASTYAADKYESFDHFATGFPLTGAHQFLDCSRCHIGGMFKGTPLECVLCHNNSRAPGKHVQHIASGNRCDNCHTDRTWIGARFDHGEVVAPCESCHNNQVSLGRSPSHIATTSQCGDCHNTLTFNRVGRVDHAAVLGTCSSCHNGVTSTGKSPQHIATLSQCDVCHNTITWKGARFDHIDVTGPCSGCHNNVIAIGKSPTHIPTTDECNSCHVTTGWQGATNNP
jgi:hypothetical protein